MKVFFIRLTVFLVITSALLKGLDLYYTRYALTHINVCEKAHWAINHKDQSFDFAFIGNSRVINMVDIDTIEKLTKKSGINLGLIGANYAENYLLLDQFIKQGNKIKNLIIQIDMHSLKSTSLPYPFHNYNYMQWFSDTTVTNIYKDNNPAYKFYMWKYIPFVRYMEYSSRFVLYKMLKGGFECKTSDVLDATKGTEYLYPKDFTQPSNLYSYWSVNALDEKYLLCLVSFAKNHDMNIILYTAPIYEKTFSYQLRLKDVLQKAKDIASSNAIPYYNLSEKNILCSDRTNFNDNIHMNITGVQKFSAVLADSISSKLK